MKRIPAHEPSFKGNEWRYVKECLDTGWVSSAGKFVARFEKDAAALTGAKHAVATVNGTSALHLSLKVLGVEAGDEVLVPSLTFIATAYSVVYLGAIPRFFDVEETTFGMDPDLVVSFLEEECVVRRGRCYHRRSGRRVGACLPMHTLGHPVRLEPLLAACRRFRVPVLEDAAEALGSFYRGKALGTFGRMGVLSFNGNKIVTSGGGGMILTDDARLAARAKHLSTQAKSDADAFWHDEVGYNYRLPNINAALGCAQLEKLGSFLKRKRIIAETYRETLSEERHVRTLWEPAGARSNFWLNAAIADSPARAARVLRALNEAGYEARPLWAPCHRQPALKTYPRTGMTVTDRLWRTTVDLPSSAHLSRRDVLAVCRTIARAAR